MVYINKRLLQTQNIRINGLLLDKDDPEHKKFTNELKLTPEQEELSKVLAAESELHRILIHLSGGHKFNVARREVVPYLVTLDVGKNKKKYQTLIDYEGILKVTRQKVEVDEDGEPVLDADGNEILEDVTTKYTAEFCGASHSRNQKQLFVESSIKDKLEDILLCGIPKDMVYPKPSKWNAYYALVTTDSEPVKTIPRIVVVDDYKKDVTCTAEVVKVSGIGENKTYEVQKLQKDYLLNILPFDGAGLVSPYMAQKWANELKCECKSTGRPYLPSCFQFRCLPAVKGEVFVFDFKALAREKGISSIIDMGGRVHKIEDVDAILTKSQFKFWNLYIDENGKFDCEKWRQEFDKPVHGYRRTFNIASYADAPKDLKETTLLSYQPLQTLAFSDNEVEQLVTASTSSYKKIKNDVDEFLLYRGVLIFNKIEGKNEKTLNNSDFTPPYYKALTHNKELVKDTYIRSKIAEDVKNMRNELLSGKQRVHGNYQVFAPDLYGLAEWALGLPVKGLLQEPYQIYSDYWSKKGVKAVDIIRNPHIGFEHKVCSVTSNNLMRKWYQYQTATIVSGSYDVLAYTLGTADYDGDTVCCTDNKQIIAAVKREAAAGHGNLIIGVNTDDAEKAAPSPVAINDVAGLMRINKMSFQNSIGTVIDKITNLWSMINPDAEDEGTKTQNELIRKYIAVGVIVGEETIDFAKTGENAKFPDKILDFLKDTKKGYWMRYLKKNLDTAIEEKRAMEEAVKFGLKPEEHRKFTDYKCTMNWLCHRAESVIEDIDCLDDGIAGDNAEQFDYTLLLNKKPHINRKLLAKVKELHEEYQIVSDQCRKALQYAQDKKERKNIALRYRFFYEMCRNELLYIVHDIDSLMDMLILIYYKNKDFSGKSKDLLWNAFSKEMITRCKGTDISTKVDLVKVDEKHKKTVQQNRKRKRTKKLIIRSLEEEDIANKVIEFTKQDRAVIKKIVEKYTDDNVNKKCRVLAVLIFISRKMEGKQKQWRALKDDDGHFIKDEYGNNIKGLHHINYAPHWLRIKYNVPNELTYSSISTLSGVSSKDAEEAIKWLWERDIIQIEVAANGDKKVKINFAHNEGDIWFSTTDYNDAGTKIRDSFR